MIAPVRPNQDFNAPKNFAESMRQYPNYLSGYVRRRMVGATALEQAARVASLKDRLLANGDRISRIRQRQTPAHFFGCLNLCLVGSAM